MIKAGYITFIILKINNNQTNTYKKEKDIQYIQEINNIINSV